MRTTRKSSKTNRPRPKREKIGISSGNVFADLGFYDAEDRLLKAKLASQMAQPIEHGNQESHERGPRSLKYS